MPSTLRRLPSIISAPNGAPATLTTVLDALQRLCERNTENYRRIDRAESEASLCGRDSPKSDTGSSGSYVPSPAKDERQVAEAPKSEPLTYFHSRVVPAMSLVNLAKALEQHTGCGAACLSVALVLFIRFCDTTSLRPTAHMMHRLFVASLLVAMKSHIDRFPSNRNFARISGITVQEMNRLERTLIEGLSWCVVVRQQHVDRIAQQIVLAGGDHATLQKLKARHEQLELSESSCVSGTSSTLTFDSAKSDDSMYNACVVASSAPCI